MLKLVEFNPTLLPQLTNLVNQHIGQIPPGWTLTELQVALTLSQADLLWSAHGSYNGAPLKIETVCVMDDDQMAAAAQWGVPANERELPILWIASDPGQTQGLRLLLAGITRQAKMRGYRDIIVSRFSFGVGWFGIPQTWTHLVFGFEEAGFETQEKWAIMTAETNLDSRPIPPDPEGRIRLGWRANDAAFEWTVDAHAGPTLIGRCAAWGIPTHLTGCENAQKWAIIEAIEVEKLYRRQGIGQALLYEQLRRQSWRGVKNVIAWMEMDNAAARKLHESLGFAYGPECWVFRKSLPP